MKKTLLLFVSVLVSVSIFAQTRATFINEHFDGSSMPAGWQATGSGTSNWSVSGSQNAGGAANELHLTWSPQFNGTSRMVMPAVDLTGITSVSLSFKHALNNYSGSHTLGVATSSDNGATWNVGWQQSYAISSAWTVSQSITTPDMGKANVKFCLFYTGNSYNINDWYFDDIEIFSLENLDLALNSIDVDPVLSAGSITVKATVKNKGVETINDFTLSYQFEEMDAIEETFTETIASLATKQVTFNIPTALIPGSYNLTVNIMAVNGGNDDDETNNSLTKTLNTTLGSTQRIAMIEHFSSSTCGPCVAPNNTMLNVTNNNPGKFTYTKYQMNWPGNGDPYYTAEGGIRRQYYGVNAVPAIFIDAQEKSASQAATVINSIYNTPAFTDIRGSFNVDGNTITVKVDFMSFYDLNTAKAFVSVNEKETHNNVGTNGETTFHHIFMKYLTSASGNAVNIEAGKCQHFEFTQNMSGTHVEEMSDLEVSAWLQEYGTKEMLNSHFLYEYTDIHPYPVQNLTATVENGSLTAVWEAPEGENAISYNVYLNGELAGNVSTLEFTADVTEELNIVAVEALYRDDMTSVKIVTIAEETIPVVCDPVTDLVAEGYTYNGYHGALVSWIGPEGATAYKVYAGDELIETTEDQSIFLVFDTVNFDVYTIGVVAVHGEECESEMVTYDFDWTSVAETAVTTTIYPNPTTGSFTVDCVETATVEIYNLVGQRVFQHQGQRLDIDASTWNKGIYMVNIINPNGSVETRKLVVK